MFQRKTRRFGRRTNGRNNMLRNNSQIRLRSNSFTNNANTKKDIIEGFVDPKEANEAKNNKNTNKTSDNNKYANT